MIAEQWVSLLAAFFSNMYRYIAMKFIISYTFLINTKFWAILDT